MATDMELVSDEFSETACKLLKEYSTEIENLRIDSIQLLDSYYQNAQLEKDEKDYLLRRFRNNFDSFRTLKTTYQTLVRKASQWIQHAKDASPGKQLELEVRLDEFEKRLIIMHRFFTSNKL